LKTNRRDLSVPSTVRVFYPIWRAPLMTLNDAHLVSLAIRLCAENIFGKLATAGRRRHRSVLGKREAGMSSRQQRKTVRYSDWRRFPDFTGSRTGIICFSSNSG